MFQKKHLKCLLDRLDTMTMAASIEARVPFLDHKIVEFINSVPFEFKLKWKSNFHKMASLFSSSEKYTEKNDINKYLLRKLSTKYLPNKISNAKKLGFPVPLNEWVDNDEIKNMLKGKNSLSKNFYNSDYLNQILQMKKGRNYDFAGKKIWMMLNIEIWMKEHFG
jgi:asparagine synthase (glutamine-hydrolysing)